MIKCVIFDLDGVIVSTDKLHYEAWKTMAKRELIPFDENVNNLLRGVSRMESLDIILRKSRKKYSDNEKSELAEFKNNVYRNLLSSLSPSDILPGINKLLSDLREIGFKIVIGSSSKNAKTILEKIGLLYSFDAISDGTNITKSKPNPEVFIKAAQMVGLKNEECAVVEDAHSGILAAKACNMLAFAVGDARSCSKRDYYLEDLIEVLIKNKEREELE